MTSGLASVICYAGDTPANTVKYYDDNDNISGFIIYLNENCPFYNGTSTCPDDEIDLESVITRELRHALGLKEDYDKYFHTII